MQRRESSRVRPFTALGERAGLPADTVRRMISDGTSSADARQAIHERALAKPIEPLTGRGSRSEIGPGLDVRDAERGGFSLVRALRALANPDDRRAQRDAGYEFEISAALSNHHDKKRGGLCIPTAMLGKRANLLADSALGTGGAVLGTELLASQYVTPLYNQAKVIQSGATLLTGLTGNVAIPKGNTASSPTWVTPEAANFTESAPTFGQINLVPHDLACYTDISRRLLIQATPAIEQILRDDFARVLAIGIDAAALTGLGTSGSPTGVMATSGVTQVAAGTNGASPALAIVAQLIGALAGANALSGRLSWLATGALMAKMLSTQKCSYGGESLWSEPSSQEPQPGERTVSGFRAFPTNNLPSNTTKGTSGAVCSTLMLANWQDLLIGEWGVLEILSDPYSQSISGTVRLTAIQSVDVGVRHAASFAYFSDLLTV